MESISCPICMHEFDTKIHIPMILHCGHTFCKKCIEGTERKMGALQCSLCRSLDFREVSIIKKNIIVFQNLNPSGKVPLVPCSSHSNLESIFFCLTESIPFCSKCATMHKSHDFYNIDDPIITQGTDIEINAKSHQAETQFKKASNERSNIVEVYNLLEQKKSENVGMINTVFDQLIEEIKRKRLDFVQCLNGKYNSAAVKIQKVISKSDDIIERKKRSIEQIYNVKRELGRLAGTSRYKAYQEISNLDMSEESLGSELELLKSSVETVKLGIEINTSPISQLISELSPGESIREEILQWKPAQVDTEVLQNNPEQVKLIRQVLESGIDVSQKVQKVLESTDRKLFMPTECDAYADSPQRIGFNTTISAPHMHAYTLNWLEKYCVPGSSILDVGCGSGYLTVCLAKLIGSGKVFGVDHIEELINQAMENIWKSHPEMVGNSEIQLQMICRDGRLGLVEFAPFNVIHIGAATMEIPRPLIEQLAPGGIILAPIGPPQSFQKITLCQKDMNGSIHYSNLLNVNYAPLTDRERQCPNVT